MTQSIATLGIRVTSNGVTEAERDLGKLSQAGAKVEQQAGRTAKGMQQTAMSAKQLQAATRGLPAQFTDIATGLASGQRPMQVLLQQGGQLKDMFGGIGPAFRAMGGYIAGMINPVTLLAGASIGLFAAWRSGVADTEALRTSLILTGNAAGTTSDELRRMSRELDASTAATAGKAAQVIAQVTATGRFTADQIRLVSEAAINMEAATGKAIEDTVKEFVSLSGDPVSAILKLNEAQNFLTRETLEQIESLKKQGREADAAAVAVRAYADVINSRSAEVTGNLDAWAVAMNRIKSGAREAFDELKAGIDKANYAAINALPSLLALKDAAILGPLRGAADFAFSHVQKSVDQWRSNLAGAGVKAGFDFAAQATGSGTVNNRDVKFEQEAAAFRDRYLTREEQKKRALAELDKYRAQYSATEYANLKKQIELQYAPARTGGARRGASGPSDASIASARDRFNDMVGRFKAELGAPLERVEQNHLRNMRELEQAAKAGKVSHEDLAAALAVEAAAYAKSSDEVRNRLESEVAALSGPVAQAQADHEEALRRIEELQQQLGLSGDVVNKMLEEEARVFGMVARDAQRAADPIGALLDDMAAEIDMIGRSSHEQAVMNELRRQGIKLTDAQAQSDLAAARALDVQAESRQRVVDLMDGFRAGAVDAFTDIVTGAKSAKEAFKDFFDSLAAMITRMIAEKWMASMFGAQGTDGAGTSGGGWLASIFGALFGGGRAIGGPVSGGKVYEVNERGAPEIYSAGGRQFLLAPRDGKVTPAASAGNGGGGVVHQTFVIQGRLDSSTESQLARRQGRAASNAMRRM